MSMLMLVAVILISCNVAVALISSADLRAKRNRLAKLEERREQVREQLKEVERHRKLAEGTQAMHKRLKAEKEAQMAGQQQFLGELEKLIEEEREIKVAGEEDKERERTAESNEESLHDKQIRTRIPTMKARVRRSRSTYINRKEDRTPAESLIYICDPAQKRSDRF